MYSLTINSRKEGSVWQSREQNNADGPVLSISNNQNNLKTTSGNYRIVCASIEYPLILTCDVNGVVYRFNLQKNKFKYVNKVDSCCTALAFVMGMHRERDILVATANCYLHVLQSSTGKHVAKLLGHETSISHIAVDNDGLVAITSSLRKTVVWDLVELKMRHQLMLSLDADLVKSIWIPQNKSVISCYKNNQFYLWSESKQNMTLLYEVGPVLVNSGKPWSVSTVAVSSDGRHLAAGGKASWLLLWQVQNIDCPTFLYLANKITRVVKLAFVNLSSTKDDSLCLLIALSQDGCAYMYETITSQLWIKIESFNDKIINICCSNESGKMSAVTSSGIVEVYDLEVMLSNKNFKLGGDEENDRNTQNKLLEKKILDETQIDVQLKKERSCKISSVTIERLKGILKEYGTLPEKYRLIVWSSFLDLPNDCKAFKALYELGFHEAYEQLEKHYPVASSVLYRSLKSVLSMLCHWCPQLVEVSFIPSFVFPFVKMLHHNLHMCLEVVIAFFCIYATNWCIMYPYPNMNIIIACENILKEHDPSLLLHFVRHGVAPQVYTWRLLTTLFTEVLNHTQCVKLYDHIFANRPNFLLYLVVAFSLVSKKNLMRCVTLQSFKSVFSSQIEPQKFAELIKRAYQLHATTSRNTFEQAKTAMELTIPVTPSKTNSYPCFSNFPSIVVDVDKETLFQRQELKFAESRQLLLLNEAKYISPRPAKILQSKQEVIENKSPNSITESVSKTPILNSSDAVRNAMKVRSQAAYLQLQRK